MIGEIENSLENIIMRSIESRASDVHIEPEKLGLKVRFRIDGVLQQYKTIGKIYQETLINKIKVASKINITDHRLPQDGHPDFD